MTNKQLRAMRDSLQTSAENLNKAARTRAQNSEVWVVDMTAAQLCLELASALHAAIQAEEPNAST